MQDKIRTDHSLYTGALWASYDRQKPLKEEDANDDQVCLADQLVKNLASLREFVLRKRKDTPSESLFHNLEQFSYCVSGTCFAFLDLAEYLAVERQRLRMVIEEKPEKKMALQVGHRNNQISYRVDRFFEIGVRLQNSFCTIMSLALSVSLPGSLRKLMENAKRQRQMASGHILTPDLVAALKEYWDYHGNKLRDYRDLSQHYPLSSSDIAFGFASNDEPVFSMLLPNNPKDVLKGSECKFNDPQIQAFDLVISHFVELIKISNQICDLLLPPAALKKGAQLKWRASDVKTLTHTIILQPIDEYLELIRTIAKHKGNLQLPRERRVKDVKIQNIEYPFEL